MAKRKEGGCTVLQIQGFGTRTLRGLPTSDDASLCGKSTYVVRRCQNDAMELSRVEVTMRQGGQREGEFCRKRQQRTLRASIAPLGLQFSQLSSAFS